MVTKYGRVLGQCALGSFQRLVGEQWDRPMRTPPKSVGSSERQGRRRPLRTSAALCRKHGISEATFYNWKTIGAVAPQLHDLAHGFDESPPVILGKPHDLVLVATVRKAEKPRVAW